MSYRKERIGKEMLIESTKLAKGKAALENADFRLQCGLDECETCGSSRNNRSVRKYETREGVDILVECSDCKLMYCETCGQEHNAESEFNAGYCQHCKTPVLDYSTGKFYQ